MAFRNGPVLYIFDDGSVEQCRGRFAPGTFFKAAGKYIVGEDAVPTH